MSNQSSFTRLIAVFAASSTSIYAGCFSECCPQHRAEFADAVVLASVTSLEVREDGSDSRFVTVATLNIEQEFEEREIPEQLVISIPGGTLGGWTHFDSRHVDLVEGENYLMHLRKGQESWSLYQASAEHVSDGDFALKKASFSGEGVKEVKLRKQSVGGAKSGSGGVAIPASRETSSGYIEENGVPSRLRRCDTGQPLLVEVDSEVLPSGVSQSEAIAAVRSALDAWEAESGLSFIISSNYDFNQTSRNMNGGETTLHIQLHNSYGEIGPTSTLGIGGRFYKFYWRRNHWRG